MKTYLKELLLKFEEKTRRLNCNLDNFKETQVKFIDDIEEEYEKCSGTSQLATTASAHCLAVLLHVDDVVDRLNMILEFIEPSIPDNVFNMKTDALLTPLEKLDIIQPPEGTCEKLPKKGTLSQFILSTITFVQDLEELLFYAWDNKNPCMLEILKLGNLTANLHPCKTLPAHGVIFGVFFENYLFRAILSNPKNTMEATLIDLGEKISIDMQVHKFYELPINLQQIPEQAILCKLIGVVDKKYSTEGLQNLLKESIYERTALVVERIQDGILHVLMVEKVFTPKRENKQANGLKEENIILNGNSWNNSSTKKHFDEIEFETDAEHELKTEKNYETLEANDLKILNEEYFGTTNALKAVFGYTPCDDRRLCPFYDPKINGCFKGARCRLEHAPRSKEAFTSDVVPAATVYNFERVDIIFEEQQIINLTVTHIDKLHAFYVQINEKPEIKDIFIWKDICIPSNKRFKTIGKYPRLYDLVLAKSNFGLWYRAQVRNELEPRKVFEVFYVDYGNTGVVEIDNLAHCTSSALIEPFQVELIHIANVQSCNLSRNETRRGIEMLNKFLLNRTFDVRVVSHELDLFIEFIDEDKKDMIGKLCQEGLLKRIC